ncbi:MAG: hypothetical protein GXO75_08280 [Calditrichaeota bacterium]|nr:hypothetical protein [Calditrichota bacterium]
MKLYRWIQDVWRSFAPNYCRGRCPECEMETWFRWENYWVVHPEEPPMFGFYSCCECGFHTPIIPTKITVDVLKKDFGMTWEEFAEKHLSGGK